MTDSPHTYNVLDLFSGIGGFSLGLERAGMTTVAFCESDGYARRVLRKHWPDTWLYEDIRTLTAKRLRADGLGPVDVVCGGFPCQDISTAGKGAGIDGPRSGLWAEMLRVIKEVKPRWVVAENVPALRGRGADRVLADLEGAGYAAVPVVVGAVHVGASHRRERVWIVAHSQGVGRRRVAENAGNGAIRRMRDESPAGRPALAHAKGRRNHDLSGQRTAIARDGCPALADALGDGLRPQSILGQTANPLGTPERLVNGRRGGGRWAVEPAVGRVAHGVPSRVDRLRCLGNAVVPLIPELIGRAIIERDAALKAEVA